MTEDQNHGSAQVLILGAGPTGLVLGNLLLRSGIDCLVLERSGRASLAARARAGYLTPQSVRTLERHGLAEGLRRRGAEHGSCEFRTEEGRFRLDYGSRAEPHTVYPQQELVADLLAAFEAAGGQVRFGTEALAVHGTDTGRPWVAARSAPARCPPTPHSRSSNASSPPTTPPPSPPPGTSTWCATSAAENAPPRITPACWPTPA